MAEDRLIVYLLENFNSGIWNIFLELNNYVCNAIFIKLLESWITTVSFRIPSKYMKENGIQ